MRWLSPDNFLGIVSLFARIWAGIHSEGAPINAVLVIADFEEVQKLWQNLELECTCFAAFAWSDLIG